MSPEGSVWRKWDLHIHTHASFSWQGQQFSRMTPEQADEACRQLVQQMNAADAAAFAVMDYWTFDGYLRIKAFLRANLDIKLEKALFPGMELRCEAPADFRMNIHVILSDELTEQQLADFKNALRIPLINRPLSEEAIAEAAGELSLDKLRAVGHQAMDLNDPEKRLLIGYKTVLVSRDSFFEAFKAVPPGKGVIFLPFDTYNGVREINWRDHPILTTEFMSRAHMFEARRQDVIDAFHGIRTAANGTFFDNFMRSIGGKPKPAVSGSDAHSLSKYGVFPELPDGGARCTWVKANPTFRGLFQLQTEPAARVHIGTEPPKLALVREHPTKYIRSISIRKKHGSDLLEAWFNTELRLNHDLVAIIGNRGNGKSALADMLGLLGRSRNHAHFSFLNNDKFRDPKLNRAKHFEATLTWEDGESVRCCLDDPPAAADVERVRYIPQNYLEMVCNEIKMKPGEGFDYELKSVIFSHVPLEERLGKASLDDLLAFKTRQTSQTIDILKDQLHELNTQIVQVEQWLTPEHRQTIQNQLELKEQELTAHDAAKPTEVLSPSDDPAAQALAEEATAEINRIRTERGMVETTIGQTQTEVRGLTMALAGVTAVEGQLDNFERQYKEFLEELRGSLADLGIEATDLVKVTIDRVPLAAKRAALDEGMTAAKHRLDSGDPNSLVSRKQSLTVQIPVLQANLDGPAKQFQEYITALNAWQSARDAIVGSKDVPGTLAHLHDKIDGLDGLPGALEELLEKRRTKAREIYGEIDRLAETYRSVYKPVQEFSARHPLINDRFGLNFSVSIRPSTGIAEGFFSIVSRHASGSFCGTEEGEQVLKALVERHDFSTADGAMAFAEELLGHLNQDRREGKNTPTAVAKQLRKQQTVEAVHDFIFSFGYFTPEYNLNLGPKALLQLSAGERGMLLLMFYLLIDKEDTPLIIDQPEGSLDNETVFLQIGECIKEAKKRRQIIIVTHNSNLAVACDAEQIIYARMDQMAGNRVEYIAGAIEDPQINRLLMDVLEGTRPAFENRDAKYFDESARPA